MDDLIRMIDFLSGCKNEILRVLKTELGKREDLKQVHLLGDDVQKRLIDFTANGKMLRGGLVCLAAGILDGKTHAEAYRAGAAMELFQSGLLIHDDIMDRDFLRRGAPSVFHQYGEMAKRSGTNDDYHLGEALGICAGDVALFLGFELLGSIGTASGKGLFKTAAKELAYVGVAQMADVLKGTAGNNLVPGSPMETLLRAENQERTILDLYRYKTGRYTFALPLQIGAGLCGAGEEIKNSLDRLGEELGILFQIKDDEIDLFGDEEVTGKPVGTDIREGKKTLFHHYLFDSAEPGEGEKLEKIFGNRDSDASQIRYVLDAMTANGVRERVSEKASEFAKSASTAVDELTGIDEGRRRLLRELIEYSTSRER